MGSIKKVLHCSDLGRRTVEALGIWFDLCENCHLHFKNYRFDFSVREWALFVSTISPMYNKSYQTAGKVGWREGQDPGDVYTISVENPYSFSDYYPYRLLIEWQRDNTVHIHYREFRLRLSEEEFDHMVDAFIEAREQKNGFVEQNFKPGRQVVPIDSVQPYDEGHICGAIDEDHARGIKYVKKLIKEGKKILPILIRPDGQRLDGFKRYMAFKELGYEEIEVIVDPKGEKGDQENKILEI